METNTVALVTGGNKGIGLEIVRQLAQQGFTVYLGARDPRRGRAAAAGLAGLDVRFVRLDVTDPESVEAAVRTVEAETGRLDVLVNNAGVVVEWGVRPTEITAEQLREAYEVNVFGVVTVTAACLPLLRRSGAARIVNMSSGLGSLTLLDDPASPVPSRDLLAYSSSKAALNALTVLYADALRADGIKVNAASPGAVPTDQNVAATFYRGDRTAAEGARVPVLLATLPADGPTGSFRGPRSVDDVIPW
ncbi:SDR family oxidoreductase [Kibdelosporangium phytohabitans]|uniref:Dehydrogenase n=1 Tax=Kibdelosporangium phytohabitans TaxID=860235 RepID=A0A0N9IGJ3_9PSEU|nr:SDR family oxidoreductase [Kibdelosporangium phytohabitans]ALG13986.1 dehydrogenase [Kibdelosporangium phytohabitans]MBE1467061.1 NAD(P)-dependent dehydrogenase (short-subunit alcohol dehydrogenase family) [Kibdelosporangium phytohabitans]